MPSLHYYSGLMGGGSLWPAFVGLEVHRWLVIEVWRVYGIIRLYHRKELALILVDV